MAKSEKVVGRKKERTREREREVEAKGRKKGKHEGPGGGGELGTSVGLREGCMKKIEGWLVTKSFLDFGRMGKVTVGMDAHSLRLSGTAQRSSRHVVHLL